jgi:hypothetical protein
MRPQSSSIVTESFVTPIPVSNTFETIQRKILRQANGSVPFRRKNAHAKFTLIDMPFLSHEFASMHGERIKRTLTFAHTEPGTACPTRSVSTPAFSLRNNFRVCRYGDTPEQWRRCFA